MEGCTLLITGDRESGNPEDQQDLSITDEVSHMEVCVSDTCNIGSLVPVVGTLS